ncbi:MAG TPA: LD-carboxypeptidase [Bacteroidales bacterium]|nr:LD-carboxypeptidase [Bacteroidales bacterium]
MIRPPFLKKGDTIGIAATARKISEAELMPAITKFREWGFQVLLSEALYAEDHQFAGTDQQRLSGFQKLLDNNTVKAIIIARGGYGTVRLIDEIDFTSFKKNPKWIIGYSDVTVLHSHIHQNFGIETIHATMPLNFPKNNNESIALSSLYNALTNNSIEYIINPLSTEKTGETTGILTGGNLSLLYALSGTVSDIYTNGKILFLEDIDEYLYHIDRMILQLKRCGKLKNLAGLIVGGMTDMKDNQIPFGKNAYEIIADAVKEYDYPVCYGFPAGHMEDNRALILGRKISLAVTEKTSIIQFL